MDNSARSDAILALGRKLVEELGLEPSVDTLGRWMAHYIAELIIKAESATGEEKQVSERDCFNAILAIWEHRAELPNGKRPFEELEPIVRTIQSLDPDDNTPRYFRSARQLANAKKEKSEAEAWLDMVNSLDSSAKLLIGYCLAEAARASIDKSQEWIKLAEAAGTDDDVAEIIIRYISSAADLDEEPDLNAEVRRRLEDRLKRLNSFVQLAEKCASDMKKKLESLSPRAP